MRSPATAKLKAARDFIRHLSEDDIMGVTAQVSFYALFSLFPLLIFVLSILGRFDVYLERRDLEYLLPSQLAAFVELAPESRPEDGYPALVSLAVSLWSASRSIWALMRGVHRAYCGGRLAFSVRTQALTVAFTLGLVLSLGVSSALWLLIGGRTPQIVSSAALIYLFTWALYTCTPGRKRGSSAAPGALIATAVWLSVNAVFGAMSEFIFPDNPLYSGVNAFLAVTLWIFAVSAGIMLGAEINTAASR